MGNETDRKREIITEFIAASDLTNANSGEIATFQIQDQKSILDLTVVPENIASKIQNLIVSDQEPISDHNNITRLKNPSSWQPRKLE